jgi:hypothetical protein
VPVSADVACRVRHSGIQHRADSSAVDEPQLPLRAGECREDAGYGAPLDSFAALTNNEVVAASHALTWLMPGSLDGLATLEALGYDAYTFSPSNGHQYYLLHEPSGPYFRGLGLVVVNRAPATNVVIHGKHIGNDTKSHITTRQFFEELGAVALI